MVDRATMDNITILDWDRHVEPIVSQIWDQVKDHCRWISCPHADENCPKLRMKAEQFAGQIFAQKALWN